MNKFLWLTFFRVMAEADGLSGGGGTAVVDAPAAAESAPAADSAPAPIEPSAAASDPNDPMTALEAAMAAELGDETPAEPAAPEGEQPAIPEAFQQALTISEFVNSPETVQQAVRAADEVWKVATGQIPARTMLEGFEQNNPEQFNAIMQDLVGFIEERSGQKFGAAPDAPVDPRDARLAAIEQQFQQEQAQRQQAAYQQQMGKARETAVSFITEKAKGTFAEGHEAYLLQQCASKVGIPEKQMVEMLLSGKTEKLEAAYRAVVKEEAARFKTYGANVIKKHRTLGNAVPAVKGGTPQGKANQSNLSPLAGETAIQQVERLTRQGLL